MQQLERKIQQMVEQHEQEKEQMQREFIREKDGLVDDFEGQLRKMQQDYEN